MYSLYSLLQIIGTHLKQLQQTLCFSFKVTITFKLQVTKLRLAIGIKVFLIQ